jgi:tetratricopeptide (TPR) repeat protein
MRDDEEGGGAGAPLPMRRVLPSLMTTAALACLAPEPRAQDPVGPRVDVLLPEARWPQRRALAGVRRIVAEIEAPVPLQVVWPEGAEPDRRAVPDGIATRVAGPASGSRDDLTPEEAFAVFVDAQGHEALVEPFDDAVRYHVLDLLAGLKPGRRVRDWISQVGAAESTSGMRAVLRAAAEDLAARPEHLARVVSAALGFSSEMLQDRFLAGLGESMFAAAPRSEDVQALAFRLRDAAGDADGARQAAFAWIESVKGRTEASRALVDVLRATNHDGRYDEVLGVALDIAALADPEAAVLQRIAFEHRLRTGDARGARRAGESYVRALEGDPDALNAFAWKLLTERPYRPAFAGLALRAAEAMTSAFRWETYWRLDTLAMACFENGRFDEAVRWQEQAVELASEEARPRYEERLAAYRDAAIAPVPPARR